MRTAQNVELELLTNPFLSPVQVNDLKTELAELRDQEEAAQMGRDAQREADGSDPAETLRTAEVQLDDMEAERDGAVLAYQQLLNRVVDAIYEEVDNEATRTRLLDIAYGTVE